MSARKTPLLAYSEYVSPDPQDSIQASRARLLLFETIKSIYPGMLKDLSYKIFPLFEKLASAGHRFWGIDGPQHVSPYEQLIQPSAASSGGGKADTPASIRIRRKLKSAFDVWAKKYHLTERWAKDEAVRTLEHWHRNPQGRRSLRWNPFYVHSSRASTGERLEFRCEGWETELLTWSTYSKSVRQRFEKKLLEYETATRQRAESCGLVRSRRTISQANFEWFTLYQFAGLSSVEIASKWSTNDPGGIDPSTILKGVKTIAEVVGWKDVRATPNRKTR